MYAVPERMQSDEAQEAGMGQIRKGFLCEDIERTLYLAGNRELLNSFLKESDIYFPQHHAYHEDVIIS